MEKLYDDQESQGTCYFLTSRLKAIFCCVKFRSEVYLAGEELLERHVGTPLQERLDNWRCNDTQSSDDDGVDPESVSLLVKDHYGRQDPTILIKDWRSTMEDVHMQSLMHQKKYDEIARHYYVIKSYRALIQLAHQRNNNQAKQILQHEIPKELKETLDQVLIDNGNHPIQSARQGRENRLF